MSEQLLQALCDAPGVSGWEDAVRDLARAELEPHADEVRVDRLGNLIAVRRAARDKGDPPPLKVMVAAHLDEIGFMVKAIDQRGFIRVQPVGGFDPRTLVSQRALIHGRQRVGAVFAPIPNWIESEEERRRVTPLDQLVLDTGLPGDTVRARVEVGDYVTLAAQFAALNDRVVVARNFDDRLGVYVLAEMFRNRAFCRNSGALMRNWGVKTRGLICRGCTSSNTPSGRQWRLTRPEFAADAASVTAHEQNCPVSPAGEQLGDRWYVAATKSGFQFTKRSNWSTVNARTPNIRWHSTLLWPRTRTCRAPNSSFSRPLTRSTVDRSR